MLPSTIPIPPHPTPIPCADVPPWWLEGCFLALGHECLSERCGLGSSTEEGTSHGDFGLAAGDGPGAQRGGALSSADGWAAHLNLGTVPLQGRAAQVHGRPALGDAGVPHGNNFRQEVPEPAWKINSSFVFPMFFFSFTDFYWFFWGRGGGSAL